MTSTVTCTWKASPLALEALERFESVTGYARDDAINHLVNAAVTTLLGGKDLVITVDLKERWLEEHPEQPVFTGRCFRWLDAKLVGLELLQYQDPLAQQILFRLLDLDAWRYSNCVAAVDLPFQKVDVSPMATTFWCTLARHRPAQMGHWRYDVQKNLLQVQFTANEIEGYAREQMIAQLGPRG